jgi:hypothetical protein
MALCLAFRLLPTTTMVRQESGFESPRRLFVMSRDICPELTHPRRLSPVGSRPRRLSSSALFLYRKQFDTLFVQGWPLLSFGRGQRIISTGVKNGALPSNRAAP